MATKTLTATIAVHKQLTVGNARIDFWRGVDGKLQCQIETPITDLNTGTSDMATRGGSLSDYMSTADIASLKALLVSLHSAIFPEYTAD